MAKKVESLLIAFNNVYRNTGRQDPIVLPAVEMLRAIERGEKVAHPGSDPSASSLNNQVSDLARSVEAMKQREALTLRRAGRPTRHMVSPSIAAEKLGCCIRTVQNRCRMQLAVPPKERRFHVERRGERGFALDLIGFEHDEGMNKDRRALNIKQRQAKKNAEKARKRNAERAARVAREDIAQTNANTGPVD